MGTHVTIDVYGITGLDTIEHVETTLSRVVSAACVSVASSTLQHLHLHPVPATGGISGVAVLSDGHISFHSRPGAGYAVLDISSGAGEMHRWVAAAKAAFGNCQIVTRVHKGFEMTAGSDNDRGQSAILAAVMPQRRQRAGLKSVRVKAA